MPQTKVVYFKDDDGSVPVLDWLKQLRDENRLGFEACLVVIKNLKSSGHELRRPTADYLRDGIYELRTKYQRVQYRILYFFNGKDFAVLGHAIIKEGSAVPDADIERALKRLKKFVKNPKQHTWEVEIRDAAN